MYLTTIGTRKILDDNQILFASRFRVPSGWINCWSSWCEGHQIHCRHFDSFWFFRVCETKWVRRTYLTQIRSRYHENTKSLLRTHEVVTTDRAMPSETHKQISHLFEPRDLNHFCMHRRCTFASSPRQAHPSSVNSSPSTVWQILEKKPCRQPHMPQESSDALK